MSSEELNKEILQLYNYIKKSKEYNVETNTYPDRSIDRYSIDPDAAKQHYMQEIIKQGIITIKNKNVKIKHKYRIRHRIL